MPTQIVRPTQQATPAKSSASWFDDLPDAPSQPTGAPAPRPDWSQGPRSVPVPQPVAKPQAAQPPADTQVLGVTDFGAPITNNDQFNSQVTSGEGRVLEKAGEGATLGTLPYGIAAAKTLGGTPFQEGLQQARDYSAETSKQYPGVSQLAEAAGSVIPTVATFGALNPLEQAAVKALPTVGRPIVQALGGAGLGAASEGGKDIGTGNTQNIGQDMLHGAEAGGIMSSVAPVAGAAVSPFLKAASPEVAQLAQLGRDTYDIPISAGQISGNRLIRLADSGLKSIPFSGHANLDHEIQGAVNSAVSRTFGEDAPKLTPQVMQAARTRIGGVLQDVESRNTVQFDNQTMHDLAGVESSARAALTDPEYDVIRRQLDGVMQNVQPSGGLAGTTYGNLMHKGSPLDAAASSANPNVANYAGDIKDILRGSLQRSISGDDLTAYNQARLQWKNMRTVEPLTQAADVVGGASPSTGDINPVALRAAVNKAYQDVPYRKQGEIPLNDIADIGQRFLKEPGNSHTTERGWLMHMLGMVGGGAAIEHGGIPSAHAIAAGAAGLAGSVAASRGASKILQSDSLANAMIRNGLGQQAPSGPVANGLRATIPAVTGQTSDSPGPSVNPSTGLPQFSLDAAQSDGRWAAAQDVMNGLRDGSISTRGSGFNDWMAPRKQEMRKLFGGQGLQNIQQAAALTQKPGTVFQTVANSGALKQFGLEDGASLAGLAMMDPKLTKMLAQVTKRTDVPRNVADAITKAAQSVRS